MDLKEIAKIIEETSQNCNKLIQQSDVLISKIKNENPELSKNFAHVFEDFEGLKKSIKNGSSSKVDEIIQKYGDKNNR